MLLMHTKEEGKFMAGANKTFWQEVRDEAQNGLEELKGDYARATQAAQKAEVATARALIKAGELYEKYGIEERTWAAATGAKAGALIGWKAGPVGLKAGALIGGGIGLAFGKAGVDKIRTWRDAHNPTKITPTSNDDKPGGGGP